MQPSAPALGMPPGSKGSKSLAAVPRDRVDSLSACAIATRSGHLLTRLSLHGQGVRAIEGLEACHNLQVLILSFNEISSFDGLAGLNHLRHLDLGYNIIEGVQRYHGATCPQVTDSAGGSGSSAPTPDNSSSIACNLPSGRIENTRSAASKETPRSGVLTAAPGMEVARPEGGGESGRREEVRDKECPSPATAEIALPCLTRLDLNNNILHNLDDLKALWYIAPSMTALDMRGNPLRAARTYRGAAIRGIPGLELLDGKSITHREASLHNSCRRYPAGSPAHAFSPFRPHDGLPPPNIVSGGTSRGGAFPGDRAGRMSVGEERFVQAITLKLKAGPAPPGVLGTDGGGGGDSAVAGQHRGGGAQPNHGSVKWAPLSTTRRIGSGGGPKRPLKLTSMHFTSEDERGGSGSRGGPRNIAMGLSAGVGNGGNGGGGHGGSSGRTSLGAGGAEKSGATTLATLDVGTRVSPALPYGKSASLPGGGSGIGLIGGRFER